ncbi:hypothetical protein LCGC14_0599900 [marine sediment metagenome]|uniref:Uncharacterized protein n=1 Tax=marine sediment metagenome TaxID=412755 RepID=A0A0F9RUS2_9ZZZZ
MWNFAVLLISSTQLMLTTAEGSITGINSILMALFSALIMTLPIIILMDGQKGKFRKKLWDTMKNLNLNNMFVIEISLRPVENYEDLK